ncbi:response regulator [Dolichospermum sp. UHCC 0684]|uniref:hybrid sensor histidine kinase/response regulator n=1 Tax=unclassified Dolichospermum TaxID=2622029 RepID=UPI001447C0FC|nr:MULTISPECIES: response regulator [unclassified Dolichospermum]MEA5528773.1 response regulator [Dolichospermum sp. UHCC 0684]MTJ37244.1 response regulator [Dolichospermum sp. UHCC 0260]
MQPEQQQRILGYFLEEAREHLNTIEQGLLNLQSTLEDSEMINEVFRAAHSIKGGAAMLGLSSIQQTSHRLEDCFKILKEHPIQVDQRLESLLLDVCDTLKALIDSLGNPFGLSAEKAQALMLKTEPVMQWLNEHIETLLKQGNNRVNNLNHNHLQPPISVIPQIQKSPVTTRQNQDWTEFQGQVLEILREMLQQFKQTNLGRSRENLQECCHQLVKIGRDLNLSNWCSLCESAALAISNPDHSYLTLAKIIITEIKQAQELVLQNQDAKIAISQQLETLFPLPQLELLEFEETEAEETLFTDTTELNLEPLAALNTTNTTEFINQSLFNHHQSILTHNPPEIGLSELNSLADLFESDTPDLDDNWQQEEILEDITNYQLLITNSEVEENHHDLADFLFFENDDKHETTANNGDELTVLFDDNLLETDNISLSNLQSETVDSQPIEFGNLLDNSPDLQFPSDDVLTELISISREYRQLDPENEATNTNKLEELLTFTEDDELSVIFEITEAENIALSEIASASEISFDNLLLEEDKYAKSQADENANSSAKIIPTTIKTSKIKPSAPESLSLDNLFVEVAKNPPPVTNEIDDLFGTSEITTNLANSIDNLDNFWDDLDTTDSEITTSVNQDIAKELEQSLFSASVEIVPKNQLSATNNSLDTKEFDLISQAQEQSFDLFFTSDTDSQTQTEDNLFGDFGDVTTEPETDISVVGETSPQLELANGEEFSLDEFAAIEAFLDEPASATLVELSLLDEFAAIEAFLSAFPEESTRQESIQDEDFAALEALLSENEDNGLKISSQPPIIIQPTVVKSQNTFLPLRQAQDNLLGLEDEFSELENLLEQADKKISNSSATSRKTSTSKIPRPMTRRTIKEESMKIPVKQLDDMSNLVGELVVNRNTLEQDHERLRQALDSLLLQVQHLSDVGMRMQEYYERSLVESSLLSTRRSREYDNSSGNSHNRGFSEIEMDRFTPFHILAQEMIEFIVRVRESASDIDFITEETEQVVRQLRQATSQLQAGLTKARMVPFAQAVDRLRRGVRDNAIRYGKQVELVTEGVDTLVDKMILDHLTDPLTHMVNNAIAHGIETPEIRQAAGKSPTGIINIRALQQGNQTIISVSDDGAGIDHQKVKNKAVKKGILTPEQAQTMPRIDAYELLFFPSFSTADEVDDIKGRGVGMNVVQNDISEIRGTVGTDSTLGKGTSFTIRLPLTLSICKALFCICDRTRIAFPMDGVEDTLSIAAKNIQQDAEGQSFIVWRDINLPFQPLKDILVFNRQLTRGNVYGAKKDDDLISVIIVRSGNTMIALQIDQILSEQEIVIKQFEGPAPKPSGIAGATVLGDGMIMPIADVLEIIDIFQGKMPKHIGGNWQHSGLSSIDIPLADKVEITVLIVDDSITVRQLLSLTFTKAGYRVEQARDGQEAWDKLRSGLPCDIVFCDIEMPRCDGLEFLSRIQKDSSFDQLPIAILTSRGADKHRQMALQLGASGYLTKPYLEEALLEAASRMLKGEKLVIA